MTLPEKLTARLGPDELRDWLQTGRMEITVWPEQRRLPDGRPRLHPEAYIEVEIDETVRDLVVAAMRLPMRRVNVGEALQMRLGEPPGDKGETS